MTEIEQLIEQAENVLASLPPGMMYHVAMATCVLYIEGYIEGLYIEPLIKEQGGNQD